MTVPVGVPCTAPLALLQLGSPARGTAELALRRAADRLRALVTDVRVHAPLSSGLGHEAGTAAQRAALLSERLQAGDTAVLGVGPVFGGRFAGADLVAGSLLPHVGDVTGTVVGAIAHGSLLTALAWSCPELRVVLGPPVAECIGSQAHPDTAARAAQDLLGVLAGGSGGLRAPLDAHVGAQFDALETEEALGPLTPIVPRAIRTGTASGRVAVAHLATIGMLTSARWTERLRGSILVLEVGHMRAVEADDFLYRLRWTGTLGGLAGLVVSVPVRQFDLPWQLPLGHIVSRAVEGMTFPVACSAFVGSGHPCPVLEVGAEAELVVTADDVVLTEGTRRPSLPC